MQILGNEKGFSLAEMLIVLFITMLLFGIVAKVSYDYIGEYNDTLIEYEIQLKLREVQFYAYSNVHGYIVQYYNHTFRVNNNLVNDIYFVQELPPNVDMLLAIPSGDHMITFKSDLSTSGIAALKFQTKRGIVSYTLNLGKGRISYVSQ